MEYSKRKKPPQPHRDTMYCPRCGLQNKDEAKFCQECGARIKNESNTLTIQAPRKPTRSLKTGIAIFVVIIILIGMYGFFYQSNQANTHQSSTKIVVTPTPVPAPIVGTWEGTIDFGILIPYASYRVSFYPYHQFVAEPLTSEGTRFSGTWNQCVTDVSCLPTQMMYQTGKQYTRDNYKIQVNVKLLGQSQTIEDIVLLKDGTLNYRGTQHKI